jgi:hypothetical protein
MNLMCWAAPRYEDCSRTVGYAQHYQAVRIGEAALKTLLSNASRLPLIQVATLPCLMMRTRKTPRQNAAGEFGHGDRFAV